MANVLGVIGAGGIAQFHFRAFEETKTKVRIVADINKEAAQRAANRFDAECATDYRAVVSNPDVNAVVVLGPSPLHYEAAKAALEHGKHVICEKTLTLSPETSYELGLLAEQKGLCLFTSYMKRFFPAVQKAKELMPRLGHIMSVYCRTYQGMGGANTHTGEVPEFFTPGPDGVSPIVKMSGGGVLICGGSHLCDLLLHLVGKPESLYARLFEREGYDVDFMAHAFMNLPEGGVVHFEANWHPLKRIGYERNGWDEGIEISGVNGRLVLNTPLWCAPEHNAPILRFYDNEAEAWVEYATEIVNPFVEAEKHFLAQIERGEQGTQDCYTGYRTDYLLHAIAESARAGSPLRLDWRA